MTQYLGFPHYGDEYKVMGLAPYGEPKYLPLLPELRKIVRLIDGSTFELDLAYFRHHRENFAYKWSDGCPHVGTLLSPLL